MPNKLIYESDLISIDSLKKLEKMGHKVSVTKQLGCLMGILCPFEEEIFIGASDSSSPVGGTIGY